MKEDKVAAMDSVAGDKDLIEVEEMSFGRREDDGEHGVAKQKEIGCKERGC